jgi:hypothetical protein
MISPLIPETMRLCNKLSAFVSNILEVGSRNRKITAMERKQIDGYRRHPVLADEFELWDDEVDLDILDQPAPADTRM